MIHYSQASIADHILAEDLACYDLCMSETELAAERAVPAFANIIERRWLRNDGPLYILTYRVVWSDDPEQAERERRNLDSVKPYRYGYPHKPLP